MHALFIAAIYFGAFLLIGFAAKRWLSRTVDLSDVQGQAGTNRKPRRVFLLGVWRKED
jgi:hypothetical protein